MAEAPLRERFALARAKRKAGIKGDRSSDIRLSSPRRDLVGTMKRGAAFVRERTLSRSR